MKNNTIHYITFLLLTISCSTIDHNSLCSLKKTDKKISLLLDNNVKSSIQSLYIYKDDNQKEYLTFQNSNRYENQILFYNIQSEKLEFTIEPNIEGANGVGFFTGYYIHNLDSIFLTINSIREIAIINKEALVVDKLDYNETKNKLSLKGFYSTTAYYTPLVFNNNRIYIVPGCNRWGDENPAAAYIDLRNKTVESLPFQYPKFPGADNKAKRAGMEEYMSRCFDGNKFIYSFYFDDNIYVAHPDHKEVECMKIKSKYIDKVEYLNDYGQLTLEDICANPNYGNLIYDQFRDVYYRIAYPKTTIEKGIKGGELRDYGRKQFSVIILDNKFNIIGETLFPEYIYNSMLMFVREDGLYISESHYMNPNYSDDILTFSAFELVKN